MPKGTPIIMKCPKCRRGRYGHGRRYEGVMPIGVELSRHSGKHQGHGSGGRGFHGHRGIVQCRDCGHVWASTHPASGRIRSQNCSCRVCRQEKEDFRRRVHEEAAARPA
jgi:hypothetical protein